MKRTNIILVFLSILIGAFVATSCSKDHDIPTGKVFNGGSGGGEEPEGGDTSYEYVDLGLPSGTLWATCNVGANAPEDYGDYFAWGEMTTKSNYDWSTYKYCNGDYNKLTKYCSKSDHGYNGFTDNLTVLQAGNDVANVQWGNDWRMPTNAEWDELLNNTSNTWTTRNGVNGRLFTATNGNSLFLPAAGYRNGLSLNFAGTLGHYWSSSLYIDYPNCAWRLYFGSDCCYMGSNDRSDGFSVRPVRSSGGNSGGENVEAPTGAISGKFTINENGDKVYFSKGNLQYKASTNTWQFAANQYDYVGAANSIISQTSSGWIDLFGWGTSGLNSGAVCYQPWSTSTSNSDYYPGGSYANDLTGNYANADWGVYNAIYNGGNTAGQWRTLTKDEWGYVFQDRNNASSKYGHGKVNGQNGMILLPDEWTLPSGLSFTTGNSSWVNVYTTEQWELMEQNGAVFLPSAGGRGGTSVSSVGSSGYYWSASCCNGGSAYGVGFFDSNLNPQDSYYRCYGLSVRLVRSAQ